jgi:hypothetical protein
MKTIQAVARLTIVAACFAWVMCSCSVQVSSDGAKSFTLDGAQALRAIEILNQK